MSPGGRNGLTKIEVKEQQLYWDRFFRSEQYRDNLKQRILDGEAPHMETLLHHITYGKPKETLDLRGSGDGMFILVVAGQEVARREIENGEIKPLNPADQAKALPVGVEVLRESLDAQG